MARGRNYSDSVHSEGSDEAPSPISSSASTLIDDEATPLLPKGLSKATPLPKLQLTILVLLKMAEALTFHLIGPFVATLVKETGVIDGDEKKIGYYAGLLV
jgi:hypothetical protein